MSTTTIGIKVDQETRERLKELAKACNRTPHWIVRTALLEFLDREERATAERLDDERRWERFVLTDEAVPHEEVRDWLVALAKGENAKCPS